MDRTWPRARSAFSFLFTCLPWNATVAQILDIAHIPDPARGIARALVLGSVQVFWVDLSQPSILTNPVAFLSRTIYVSAVLSGGSWLTKSLVVTFPIVPGRVWKLAFASGVNQFVQRLARFGLNETARQTLEDWLRLFLAHSNRGEVEPVPVTCRIPTELECSICKDLLRNPVEVLGHHFCGECGDTVGHAGQIAFGIPSHVCQTHQKNIERIAF
jgi:hypothetical protein